MTNGLEIGFYIIILAGSLGAHLIIRIARCSIRH
jgi:hypothetical protein